MTKRGTYNAEGENVYLWHNIDDTYEYVPAEGAQGLEGGMTLSNYVKSSEKGNSGTGRQTGSGGRGAVSIVNSQRGVIAETGSGTSYAGGAGTGGVTYHDGGVIETTVQPTISDVNIKLATEF